MLHLSIAICDDDINVQFAIEQYLKDIFNEYSVDAEIDCYGSGEELCNHFEKGKFDLVFLDIEFTGMNGVAVGRFIRESHAYKLLFYQRTYKFYLSQLRLILAPSWSRDQKNN